MFLKVQVLFVWVVLQAYALDHHQPNLAGYTGVGFAGYATPSAPYGRYDAYASPPQPYSFGYDNVDEFGNRQFRSEQGDSSNAKTGSYGYRDANGLYRRVNYVADVNGFRVTVDTNEPGTAPGASADAVFNAAPVVPPVPSGAAQTGIPTAFAARAASPYNTGGYSGYGRHGYDPYAGAAGAHGYAPYGRQGYVASGPALGGYAYGGGVPYGYGAAGYAAGYAPGVQVLLVCLIVEGYGLHHHPSNQAVYPVSSFSDYNTAAAPYQGYNAYTYPPHPHNFGYDKLDEYGNRQFCSAQSGSKNTKTGLYGYRDENGLYGRVNYIADEYGFRATMHTNEPAATLEESADTVFNVAPVVHPVLSAADQIGAPTAYTAMVAAPYNAGGYSAYGKYGYNSNAGAAGAYAYAPFGREGNTASSPALGGYAYGGQPPYSYSAAAYGASNRPGVHGTPAVYGSWSSNHRGYRRR
ncbi:uncharacterized protein [Dermacentor andersoni]|uniref:uncharacterized protein n=1 Tax=Dermacentor andersoni TaxID=34620 RepID=UPI002416E989|nr:prisilkin-39-like [Dermacentor andersoni]